MIRFIIFFSTILLLSNSCIASMRINVNRITPTKMPGLKGLLSQKDFSQLTNPQIILWYVGEDGLTKRCVARTVVQKSFDNI